ncbi:CHASE2 domain-containing protein [Pseudomonas sp. NPDC089996]|uniref:CHASE2 domain-containing protein n=1 Tax=Pseudomonas sp. NPDC089996 TaxID=3364474 RepID=UPI0037FEE02D
MKIFCRLVSRCSSWRAAVTKTLNVLDQKCETLRQFPLVRAALYLAFASWVMFSDPFGLSSAADKALSDQLGRFRAFAQPIAPAPVTVVAIDYPSIAGLNNHGDGWMQANDWPLTYADHGRILRDIALPKDAEAAPAAIFYDIFFERPRATSGDLEQLGRTLKRLDADPSAARIHLAGGGKFVPLSQASVDQLQSASLAVSAWEGSGDLYPLQAPLAATTGAEPSATAAAALYQALCKARGDDCHWIDAPNLPDLAIQWSITARDVCRAGPVGTWQDVVAVLHRFAGLSPEIHNPPAECMPVHQVRLSQLYGEHPASLRPPHLKPGEPFVVLVGNVMPSLNDYVASPLYGQVAGVYLHANALVNLNEMGQGYVRQSSVQPLVFLCLLVAVVFWMWKAGTLGYSAQSRLTATSESGTFLSNLINAGLLTLVTILLIASSFYLCHTLHVAPEGWMALVAFLPLLREAIAATESNYSKEEPSEKTLCDLSVAAG